MNRENQIYIGRLSSRARKSDLEKEFEKYGKIKEIDLKRNHAFIEFESADKAKLAMEKMDNKKIAGERISCKPRGR
jgi:arginine/serine-rich splicing factor 7